MIAALTFFGALVVCPLVWMLMKHQRAMAELMQGRPGLEALQRLESLEREVRELRAAHHQQVLRDDDQQELSRRVT